MATFRPDAATGLITEFHDGHLEYRVGYDSNAARTVMTVYGPVGAKPERAQIISTTLPEYVAANSPTAHETVYSMAEWAISGYDRSEPDPGYSVSGFVEQNNAGSTYGS